MRNDPPCIKGENAPDWLVITGPHFKTRAHSTTQFEDPDPARIAARQIANEIVHVASLARKEAARKERIRIHRERMAAEARQREKVSRRRQRTRSRILQTT